MKRIVMNGKELRTIRRRFKLTQVELAELIGFTANTVARWERGEMTIRKRAERLIQKISTAARKRRKGTR